MINEQNIPASPYGLARRQHGMLHFFIKIVGLAVFALALSSLDYRNMPDYLAYQRMYNTTFPFGGDYYGFFVFAKLCKAAGLSYTGFRKLVLLMGVLLAFWFLQARRVQDTLPKEYRQSSRHNGVVLLVVIFMFILEFYVVRLRAGISIFFFTSAFLIAVRKPKQLLHLIALRLTQAICLFSSAVMHVETFATVALFILVPIVWISYFAKRIQPNGKVFFVVIGAVWILLYYLLVKDAARIRGAHLDSELNAVRFLAISPVPIFIWFLVRRLFREPKFCVRVGRGYWRHAYFPYMFSLNYFSAATVLAVFYLSGNILTSGEAIVRVMTLSSLGAILSITYWGITARNSLALYIAVCNALFFVYTISTSLFQWS